MNISPLHRAWDRWLATLKPDIGPEDRIPVPTYLGHPTRVDFVRAGLTEYDGQVADWVHPLPDNSRLHIHEMPDGRFLMHRDRKDPTLGPAEAIEHLFTESKTGKGLLVVGGIGLGLVLISAVAGKRVA